MLWGVNEDPSQSTLVFTSIKKITQLYYKECVNQKHHTLKLSRCKSTYLNILLYSLFACFYSKVYLKNRQQRKRKLLRSGVQYHCGEMWTLGVAPFSSHGAEMFTWVPGALGLHFMGWTRVLRKSFQELQVNFFFFLSFWDNVVYKLYYFRLAINRERPWTPDLSALASQMLGL